MTITKNGITDSDSVPLLSGQYVAIRMSPGASTFSGARASGFTLLAVFATSFGSALSPVLTIREIARVKRLIRFTFGKINALEE